jgi:micrococcal nuclease
VAAFLVVSVACGDTSKPEQAQLAPATANVSPTTTTKVTPDPSRVESPPVAALTVVTFLNSPLTVKRGSTATLQVKTEANLSCSIAVNYSSGPSTAAGLVTKSSDGAGNVSWTWKVGANTTPGTWPIKVICGNGSAQTHITVT